MGKRIVMVLLLAGMLGGILVVPAGAVDLQLAAPSAVLMDLATGTVLYESNAHERLESLPEKLLQAARARLENPESNLTELAGPSGPPAL